MPPASLPAAAAMTPGPSTDSKRSQRERRGGVPGGDADGAGAGEVSGGDNAPGSECRARGPASRGSLGAGWLITKTNKAGTVSVHWFGAHPHAAAADSRMEKRNKEEKQSGAGRRGIIAARGKICQQKERSKRLVEHATAGHHVQIAKNSGAERTRKQKNVCLKDMNAALI